MASDSGKKSTNDTDVSDSTLHGESSGLPAQAEHQLTNLARTFTGISQRSQQPHENFQLEPELDPRSGKFDFEKYIRWVVSILNRNPESNAITTAGVSFANLNVFGYGKPTDHQKTVGNLILDIPDMIRESLSGNKGRRIDILRNFEGLVREGEMLVVLGPPGSGCTTLLKTIAGETHGIPYDVMHRDFRGEVVYNAETDIHFPSLTVGQTLSFAAQARTPHTRLPGVTRQQFAHHMKDVVMCILGLTHTENTKVGNDFIRGVSGGERKRVSIAEVALSGSPLQCWDNSTRGLDSATALEFVKNIHTVSKYVGSTAVVAIYQASQSIYDLFDKVTILYEGRQIYFGRTDEAKQFFVDMGFLCPPRQTTADFLTSLTNPRERQARPGFEHSVPRTPDEFAKRWQESDDRKRLLEEIEQWNRDYDPVGGEHLENFRALRRMAQSKGMRPRSPYTISLPMQVGLCLQRGWQRLLGNPSMSISIVGGNLFLSLVTGSVFYNLETNTGSFYSRGVLLFFAILMNAFSSMLEIMALYEQRPIVEKHSRMALYHPFTEAMASMICDLPTKILNSLFINITLYFMSNLKRTAGGFFVFYLFSFFCTMTMSMIFRTIGASSRSIEQAMTPSSLFILALVIYTGFTIPKSYMRGWAKWIQRVDPISYAFESLMVNEFDGRDYPCSSWVPNGAGYENASGLERTCNAVGSTPGSNIVQGTRYINLAFDYSKDHLWRNLGIIIAFMIAFFFTYLLATEFISMSKSKGEMLVFRRGHVPHVKRSDDETGDKGEKPTVLDGHEGDDEVAMSNLAKQTSIFHWEDLCYDIKIKSEPRRILNHVDGWIVPGTLTALMGSSGAGKTTLLDTLADRITMGVITGSMFVDGQKRDDSFQRKTGYVQQQDLHLQTSTVREALIFSARLRQPRDVPDAEKVAYCEEIIRLLGMDKYADAVVGVPGEGLNVEQRKRLTIGVELAAKPQLLLFLDEPTSGLDSQTAWSICTLLRRLANSGQAILCTIHQPSALLFQEFDRLLFLARGGRPVYFGDIGENSRTLIQYFERQGADPCPPDANPAEWMLEVIGTAPGSVAKKDYAEAWKESPEYQAVKTELARLRGLATTKVSDQSASSKSDYAEFAAPLPVQFWLCLYRVFQQYWRSPVYIYYKLILCVISSLFIAFSFYKADNTSQGLQNQMFAAFMLLTIFSTLVNQIMPVFVTQRSLYEVRERPSKAYSWKAFLLANIIAEIPWQTLAAVLIYFCWYYPIGLYNNASPTDSTTQRGGLMFLLLWQFMLFTSTFAHMLVAAAPTADVASTVSSQMFMMCLIFCGVISSPDAFPGFWKFMYRVSPFTYLIDAILSTGLANNVAVCSDVEILNLEPPSGQTCGQYMQAYIDRRGTGTVLNPNATSGCQFCHVTDTNFFLSSVSSSYHLRWRNFGLLWAYIVFNIFGALALYWLIRVPKRAKSKRI
ncbi:hypothetical protein D9758_005173 [Tetrapyrgos nigripes]|uniref:ABC transporter domain-containing protein n=1 Tax=Tetrapyrgos nigripes TaxID=182062 RepID=A0A8H5LWT9_9AGAR|nr:hypothetical protein D9758_005173 [Tetrapyrgos nigripes]